MVSARWRNFASLAASSASRAADGLRPPLPPAPSAKEPGTSTTPPSRTARRSRRRSAPMQRQRCKLPLADQPAPPVRPASGRPPPARAGGAKAGRRWTATRQPPSAPCRARRTILQGTAASGLPRYAPRVPDTGRRRTSRGPHRDTRRTSSEVRTASGGATDARLPAATAGQAARATRQP